MKKISLWFIFVSLVTSFVAIGEMKTNSVMAQIGEDSQEFFEEGDREMNQEVQNLEEKQNQQQSRQQKEEKLEQELDIHQEGPRIEEVPTPDERLGLDDNLPFQPNQEIQIDDIN